MTEAHAKYAPSSTYRNLVCKGALAFVDRHKLKQKESEYAKEGTIAHEWINKALTAIHAQKQFDFEQIPDEEMRGHVQNYCHFIGQMNMQWRKSYDGVAYHIEKRVKFDGDFWGTADYMLTGRHKKTKLPGLLICDFKYGKGVEVDAEDNEQLLSYAICARKELNANFDVVRCFIFQPRTPGKEFTHWAVDRDILDKTEVTIVNNKADCFRLLEAPIERIEKNLVPGDHCRFCPAKENLKCPAYKNFANGSQLKILNDTPEVPEIGGLTLEQKVEIFKRRKVIKKIMDDVASDLLALAVKGEKIPDHKLVEGQRRRIWKGEVGDVAASLIALGVTEPTKISLIGIGEVEKEIGKGKIGELTDLTPIKYNIVPESDKKQAVTISSIEDLTEIEITE